MPYPSGTLDGLLGSGLTPLTNPDPNSLSIISPYPISYVNPMTASSAWVSQGKPALFLSPQSGETWDRLLNLGFVPSGGASVSYTIRLWAFSRALGQWLPFSTNGTQTLVGAAFNALANPGVDPIFVQIVSISSGTLSIAYDSSRGTAV
jgi:hypothetical protein